MTAVAPGAVSIRGLGPARKIVQVDERIRRRTMLPMRDKAVLEIQRLYPQIYLACHVDHVRASSTEWRLSSRDSSILAHLDTDEG